MKFDLTNRKAKCITCEKITDSDTKLFLFVYRGKGSAHADEACKNCGYYKDVHKPEEFNMLRSVKLEYVCDNFEAHGPWDYDSYYCGCNGYD